MVYDGEGEGVSRDVRMMCRGVSDWILNFFWMRGGCQQHVPRRLRGQCEVCIRDTFHGCCVCFMRCYPPPRYTGAPCAICADILHHVTPVLLVLYELIASNTLHRRHLCDICLYCPLLSAKNSCDLLSSTTLHPPFSTYMSCYSLSRSTPSP